ncbi:MAG: BolA family transcriptional regulator [gamma proteobacterium symbiont of Ctena orbiculata]|nr:MAG: BolA family transcriptional regulator [gamma proteobacterium symbiont of Ctena orbiculata]PVV19673.1 MAG: BolA family transcriptional regulator [gamma proteobacterium symbiont of Ctena orbiculata]PVV26227.1 MAG: BolA family transcriptional regulator [gamma proteobacterium symbiont of Ctena orbiculata]
MTTIQDSIQEKLESAFSPLHLEVTNESHMHSVAEGSESHFKLLIVSYAFKGEKPISRHRLVNKVLAEELQGGVHALALHTMTPEEWFEKGGKVPESPPCLGGSAQEQD